MNKKGDFASIITISVMVFIFAVVAIIFTHAFLESTDELKAQESLSNRSVSVIETTQDNISPLLDFLIFFVLVGLFIGVIVASVYTRMPAPILAIFIITLTIAIILAGQFSNIFDEITSKEEISGTAGNFTLTNLILGDSSGIALFPVILFIIGVVVVVILYGKSKSGEVPTWKN